MRSASPSPREWRRRGGRDRRGGLLVELAGSVDTLVLIGARLERELTLRAPWAAPRRGSRRKLPAIQDPARDGGILARGDQLHAAVATRAGQGVEAPAASEKGGPGELALARRIVRR